MIGVVVGGQHPDAGHAVGFEPVEQAVHRVGRVHQHRLASGAVADGVGEVHHLPGQLVFAREVAPRQPLAEIEPAGIGAIPSSGLAGARHGHGGHPNGPPPGSYHGPMSSAAGRPSSGTTPAAADPPLRTIGYLGPPGTFTEQAVHSQPDLGRMRHRPLGSIAEVLGAVAGREVDLGLVAIENMIEGSVTATIDALAFDTDLLIQREIVMGVNLNLLVRPGGRLDQVERISSYPVALRPVPQLPQRAPSRRPLPGGQLHRRRGPRAGRRRRRRHGGDRHPAFGRGVRA